MDKRVDEMEMFLFYEMNGIINLFFYVNNYVDFVIDTQLTLF